MRLGTGRKLLGGLVVGAFALASMATEAEAGWWHRAAAYCGSSGGSSGYGSGGSWGGYGSFGSTGYVRHHHRHHRHHWHASAGSHGSYGSYGSYGSHGSWGSAGSSGGYVTSHYGSWGSSGGSSGGAVYYGAPAIEYDTPGQPTPPPQPTPGATPPPPDGEMTGLSNDATLTVNVPAEAKIFVNGRPTTSMGDFRRYVSRGLSKSYDYTYEVRAEVARNGQTFEETKVVSLRGGQSLHLDFNLQEAAAVTSLTVNVPQDAKVYLSGVETSATGSTRTFTTTKLAPGTAWSDYVVKVELNRDGRTIVDEKSITLAAGDSKELSFNLDSPKVASAR